MSEEISREEIAALLARGSEGMTREEAIKWLEYSKQGEIGKAVEAAEMAIKALEQEPCEDAISRQAVEEIITDTRDYISVEGYCAILERLSKLPSVNPQEPKTGHWEWLTEDKYRCSSCKHETRVDECMTKPMYVFCPFCGEKKAESEGTQDE